MLLYLCIGMFLCILFYAATYPYAFKLKRKLKKITSYSEVTVMENPILSEEILKIEVLQHLNIERKRERLEYYIIQHKDFSSRNCPTLVLFHGLRDQAYDWIEKAKILET